LARPALPEIEALLRHDGPDIRLSAITLIWSLDKSSEKPWATVLDFVRGHETYQASQALAVVNRSGVSCSTPAGRAVIAHLIRTLANSSTRERAMTHLRTLGPKAGAALPTLFELVPRTYSARYAISSLATGPEAMAQVGPFLRHPNSSVRSAANEAAYRIGPAALADLLGALNDPDEQTAIQAANTLSNLGSRAKEAVPAMRLAAKKAKGTLKNYIDSAIRNAGG
jgi:HEAT repeat protein